MSARGWGILAVVVAGISAAPMVAHSAREAALPPAPQARVVDDTATLSRLLANVRGASPFLCELTTRSVDGRVWWSMAGSGTGGPLEMDSASAAIIRWMQNEHHDARMVPRLTAGLRDADRCVRRVSGSLLSRVKHSSATTALLQALDDAQPQTRAAAAIGLGLAETAAGVQPLIRRLGDASADVRAAAAWALGALEDKAALLPLIERLEKDADARVRQAAARAIGLITS